MNISSWAVVSDTAASHSICLSHASILLSSAYLRLSSNSETWTKIIFRLSSNSYTCIYVFIFTLIEYYFYNYDKMYMDNTCCSKSFILVSLDWENPRIRFALSCLSAYIIYIMVRCKIIYIYIYKYKYTYI